MRVSAPGLLAAVSLLGAVALMPSGLTSAAIRPAHAARAADAIEPNDNRRTAGRLANGVLTVTLEARVGAWQPDGPGGPTITTAAFAEEGHSLETPGPLLRVPAGTQVQATVHNRLAKPMWFYGMGAQRGVGDSVQIAAGATHEFRFTPSDAGTFYYAARTGTLPLFFRLSEGSQLGGVIVVDPPGARPDPAERIFAITTWMTIDFTTVSKLGPNATLVFNGRSFPNNGKIEMTQGDSAHWRFVNISFLDHPLHLHGFYFRVDARGDGARDTLYTSADRRMAVTEYVAPLQTMALSFSPDRPGNWIFHCHFAGHMSPRAAFEADRTALVTPPASEHAAHGDGPEPNHMTGLVLGITVAPRGPRPAVSSNVRNIRLLMRSQARVYGDYIGYSFALGGSPEEKDVGTMKVPGPVLELTRGERVAITIVNQSHEPTAVHWHGIELESYPDGVPGISGEGKNILPHVKPGDSLTVRFTPPRSGTFMYHSHSNEFQQISSGLYGALIVREPGAMRDADTDRLLILSDNGPTVNLADPAAIPHALLNGQLNPAPIDVRGGATTRFRLINIRADLAMAVTLRDDDKPTTWRIVAKDGFPASAKQSQPRPATLVMGAGEAYDLEVTPRTGAKMSLSYELVAAPPPLVQTKVVPVVVH